MGKSVCFFRFLATILAALSISSQAFGQWHVQSIPQDVSMLLSVCFVDENHGVTSGWGSFGTFSGKILYTTNGGTVWNHAQLPESTRSCVAVCFPNTSIGYMAGAYNLPSAMKAYSVPPQQTNSGNKWLNWKRRLEIGITGAGSASYRGFFLRTTDGGISWSPRGTLPNYVTYLTTEAFPDTLHGFVTYDAEDSVFSGILKSTNGGISWTECYRGPESRFFSKIVFVDSLNGVVLARKIIDGVTGSNFLLTTTDGGTSWTEQDTLGDVSDVYCSGTQNYIIKRSNFSSVVLRATDAGQKWEQMLQADAWLTGIRFINGANLGIVFGWGEPPNIFPFIEKTTDGGNTWITQVIDTVYSAYLMDGQILNENMGFTCGTASGLNGLMLHTSNGGISSAPGRIVKTGTLYELSQNYPNPFNPTTNFELRIANFGFVSLKVYDILGGEVATLVNEVKQPGEYTVQWNAEGIASGVYYYRLVAKPISSGQAGDYLETRKLLLIK